MKPLELAIAACLLGSFTTARADEPPVPLRASGFVEGGYAVASRALDGRVTGNLYLPRNDEFAFHAAALKLERPAPAGAPGSGFVVQAMAGGHAEVIRAAGLDLGPHADLVQAYAVMNLPAASLQVSAGKMATMLGNEVIESVANPNLSVGNQYVFVENFTDTGVDVAWSGPSGWSIRARAANGWDVVADNNRSKTVFGRLGWSDGARGVALFGYTGRELPDSVDGNRSGVELLANAPLGAASLTLQLDAGREEAFDAPWRAAGLWVRLPLSPDLDLACRADVLDDTDGARTSGALGYPSHGGQTLVSGTATLVVRAIPGALLRPELRYDRSSLPVFDGQRDQWTFAIGAAATF